MIAPEKTPRASEASLVTPGLKTSYLLEPPSPSRQPPREAYIHGLASMLLNCPYLKAERRANCRAPRGALFLPRCAGL